MNRISNFRINGKPFLLTMLLVGMSFGLAGCPDVNSLLGDAPFNGVYCDDNAAGCPDRTERSNSNNSSNSGSTGSSTTDPT